MSMFPNQPTDQTFCSLFSWKLKKGVTELSQPTVNLQSGGQPVNRLAKWKILSEILALIFLYNFCNSMRSSTSF